MGSGPLHGEVKMKCLSIPFHELTEKFKVIFLVNFWWEEALASRVYSRNLPAGLRSESCQEKSATFFFS